MTDQPDPATLATLDARRGSMRIELSDDNLSYRCVRVFGAAPQRVFRAFTDPDDLRVWFPSGAPPGSEMTRCESDPVVGGRYHYSMTVPGFGSMDWHGRYTAVEPPHTIGADEWFVMGGGPAEGPPATQTLTFERIGDGLTLMTMHVVLATPEDPETFVDQAGAGLSSSLGTLDDLVTGPEGSSATG